MPRYVIVGGTSAIAEHCARLWLEREPLELWLIGRQELPTKAVANDLKIRSPESTIYIESCSFTEAVEIYALVSRITKSGPIDRVLIAHGSLPDQIKCQNDLKSVRGELEINGISPVLFAEAFAAEMQHQKFGQIAVIGSVAGDRGRKSNYIYGSANGLVERYVEGMQHRFANSSLKCSLIKPGPTLTPMTAHLADGSLALADVREVAITINKGLEKQKSVIYAPAKWALIMLIIRHLPKLVFNRLNI